ncbi:MAG: deoxyribonuclease V [Armatimonadota bacterium]|nr:deoxyribonuclease V [Armatimonadota bacterium]
MCDTIKAMIDAAQWDLTPQEAVELQLRLCGRVVLRDQFDRVRTVAGVDVRVTRGRGEGRCAIVVLSYPELETVDAVICEGSVNFPYIPGLLAFREVPLVLQAFARLHERPDLVFFDGHGLAHPRRFGLACHAGVVLDVPSIGCAKSLLIGRYQEPGTVAGSTSDLVAPEGDVVGKVVRTRTGVKPIFVSPGHRISIESAARFALECTRGLRIPEPTRRAHILLQQE